MRRTRPQKPGYFTFAFALALGSAPLWVACGNSGSDLSEENCAAKLYGTFNRETVETEGNCGDLPAAVAQAFGDSTGCEGGFKTEVCSYRFAWDCPGDDGQTLTYEGVVNWDADERTGYGGSSLEVKDKDGNVVCQSNYDEAWAGDELAPPDDSSGGASG